MIKSLKRYAINFLRVIFSRDIHHLLRDFTSFYVSRKFIRKDYSIEEKKQCLHEAIGWLVKSINPEDAGFRTWYYQGGWTSSYPETSGYIIPTLLAYAEIYNRKELSKHCIQTADWLVKIQKPSGGWQSGYIHEHKKEVVFNTGQVIRGLYAVYKKTSEKKYLDACVNACKWLSDVQEEDGSWQQYAFMHEKRVYESYVDHPLLLIAKETGNTSFELTARKNLDWILTQQESNGWFKNCDNTIKHNDRPILHTIAYTLDGLIQCGVLLNETKYIQSAKVAADILLDNFLNKGWLQGRWDSQWRGSQAMICTGEAQMALVWKLLYNNTGEDKYMHAIRKINNQLCYIQIHHNSKSHPAQGGIPGSFPLWGRYEPFGFPNWATKYFADSLMEELHPTLANSFIT
ncbi:MAG: glycoside hydrolase family 127 protein [Flavobacteriales bacterium]|nr:glycoside hydrolase family 127 protein [Flavobacteriales bacterium]